MQAVLAMYKDTYLPDNKQHFKVKLNGIGLHSGKGVIIDNGDKLHGDVFNQAYKIGEDLCEGGGILVSDEVYSRVKHNHIFNGL